MTEPRVLDLTVDLSGMYATRLLADQSWKVSRVDIPVESPLWAELDRAGVPRQDLLPIDHHLNRGKARQPLDLASPDGWNALRELAEAADVIVESFPAQAPPALRLGAGDLRAMNPGATVVSISPYGRNGPYRDLIASDRTLWAHSGAMFLCGRSDERPMAPNIPIVSYLGGIYACIAIAAEQIRRLRLPAPGPGRHLDVALMDAISANLERATTYYSYLQSVALRGSASRRYFGGYPAGPYRARDGYFMLVPGHQPVSTVALLVEQPELVDHPLFNDRPARIREAAAFDDLILEPLAARDVDDLVRDAADLRMPCARIMEIADLPGDEQLAHRGAIALRTDGTVQIAEPWRFIGDILPAPETPPPPAPPIAAGDAPLAGMRVLDLTKAYAGPTASRILAELGAEVVKVESIDHLDIVPRGLIPCDNAPGDLWWERSGFFADRNLGKLGITLKLDLPAGRALALELARRSDVAIWNFSPRVMDNLDLSFETLRAANPGIVLTAMSGYGYSGPGRNQYALAATMEAASGWTSQMRYHDSDTPMLLGFSLLDALSGIYAATATLFAIERRVRTGAGEVVDFAARESAIPFLAYPLGDLARGIAPSVERESLAHGGRHLTLQAAGFERWVEVFVPDGRRDELLAILGGGDGPAGAWTDAARELAARWDQRALVEALQRGRFAAAPVFDGEEVLLGDHLAARELFHLVDRPTGVGLRPHARQLPGLADGRPIGLTLGPPPRVGEHNDRVFGGLLGLDARALARLREEGLIGEGPAGRLPDAWKRPLPLDEMVAQGAIVRVPGAFERMRERFGAPVGAAPELVS